ncbi:hypothetical protein M9Y10_013850 [Tritrichomonas musculus]|uniref:Uncharacterized protein n=1 Tax=Tritrichomonas musculus TaxID=1915356 RepID=A0ABR2KXX1_9EUKA
MGSTAPVVELFEVDGPSIWVTFELFHDVVNDSLLRSTQFFPFPEGFEAIDVLFTTFIWGPDIEFVKVFLDLGLLQRLGSPELFDVVDVFSDTGLVSLMDFPIEPESTLFFGDGVFTTNLLSISAESAEEVVVGIDVPCWRSLMLGCMRDT